MKPVVQHKDKLGRDINIDDCVVFPRSNNLVIGKVIKLNAKMIGVEEVSNKRWCYSGNKYPNDCVIIDSADVTMYLLKGAE